MPQWNGIEDASAAPSAVWLSRPKFDPSTDNRREDDCAEAKASTCSTTTTTTTTSGLIWKPLRKCDCEALNSSVSNKTVLIEGGRATADPVQQVIFPNFTGGPHQELTCSFWFVREE